MIDYAIVVPSRKRAHNMPLIQSLLPSALICIDETEVDDYAGAVPKDRLLLHPPLPGLPFIMNWMMDAIKQPVLVEIDDDFAGIQSNVGSKRWICEPDEILAVIENAAQACSDLGLTTFCWSRTPNTTIIKPNVRPIVPTQSVCVAFGIMGAARHRYYDTSYLGRSDVDWALRTLLEDRCIYADVRFFFDSGPAFGGRGGNVGLVDPENFKATTRRLKAKWGKSVKFKAPAWQKKRQVVPIGISVSRTNRTAQQ